MSGRGRGSVGGVDEGEGGNVDHFFLDEVEMGVLRRQLRSVAWVTEELDATVCRLTAVGERSGRRVDPRTGGPLPFHAGASDAAWDLVGTLRAWVEHVATQRHRSAPPAGRAPVQAAWLDRHLVDLALCEEAPTAAEEIDHAVSRAVRVIDLPVPLEFVGPCQAAPGEAVSCPGVYCPRGATRWVCPGCQVEVDVDAVGDETRRTLADRLYSASELRRVIGIYLRCTPPSRSTVQRWIASGDLVEHAGRFRLDEALALMASRQDRRGATR